eukprot:TRINITY_DN2483_c3_g1_i1.p1 TRINITY_DN2483_c3_g1~~TRINITY_DN2483_c3_g1_i1.p1  ORF type:complete len:308 (-),score=69.60 TRINITY_DN2483_c3_g1_i1:42-965(-)
MQLSDSSDEEVVQFTDGDTEMMQKHFFQLDTEEDEREAITMQFDMKQYIKLLERRKKEKAEREQKKQKQKQVFRTKMNASTTQEIERELSNTIKKEHFLEMKIIGQFNLGFIITKLGDNLFIVDQHATDEKYNYEQLQQKTKLQIQKLLKPMTIEFSSADEMVIMDNLEIFRMNGFDFEIDENAEATKRIKMTAYPFSQGAEFGVRDVQELIFMIRESPEGMVVRLARVSQVFASRACRKSVMIGDKLNKEKMQQIIKHMGTMTNPWSCPHGRPTIRHLVDMSLLPALAQKKTQQKQKQDFYPPVGM